MAGLRPLIPDILMVIAPGNFDNLPGATTLIQCSRPEAKLPIIEISDMIGVLTMKRFSLTCNALSFLFFCTLPTAADTARENVTPPLSVNVKPASNSQTSTRLRLTVELVNKSKEALQFTAAKNPPFNVRIYNQQGQLVNTEITRISPAREGQLGVQISFKPLEKKIYSFVYPGSTTQLPEGKYDVSAATSLLSYKLGNQVINLDKSALIKSGEISVSLKKTEPTLKNEPILKEAEGNEQVVVSVIPYAVSWSLEEPLQPKSLRIEVSPPTALNLKKVHINNPEFTSQLQPGGKAGLYSFDISPPKTKMPASAILSIEERSGVLSGYEVELNVVSNAIESVTNKANEASP